MKTYKEKFLDLALKLSKDDFSEGYELLLGDNIILSIEPVPIEDIYIIKLSIMGYDYQLNPFSVSKDDLTNKDEMEEYFNNALNEILFISKNLKKLIGEMSA